MILSGEGPLSTVCGDLAKFIFGGTRCIAMQGWPCVPVTL